MTTFFMLLAGLVIALAVPVFGGALMRPADCAVSRPVQVNATPERIMPPIDSSKARATAP